MHKTTLTPKQVIVVASEIDLAFKYVFFFLIKY